MTRPTIKDLVRWVLGIPDPVWDATDPRSSPGALLRQSTTLLGGARINRCCSCGLSFVEGPDAICFRCEPEQLADVVRPEGARLAGDRGKRS